MKWLLSIPWFFLSMGAILFVGCEDQSTKKVSSPRGLAQAQTPDLAKIDDKLKTDNEIVKKEDKINITKSGLKYEDLKVGEGKEAKAGDRLSVHYTGWLKDGTKFDSSKDRDQPLDVEVGVTRVIKGWHQGLWGMKAGGKRKLIIPAELAYGAGGRPPVIPANAELTFEVEVMEVK